MAGSVFSRNPCEQQHRGLHDGLRAVVVQMQGSGHPLQSQIGLTCWLVRDVALGEAQNTLIVLALPA